MNGATVWDNDVGVLWKSNIHAKKQSIDRLARGGVAVYLNAILFNSF
jgi:hypothetical protein